MISKEEFIRKVQTEIFPDLDEKKLKWHKIKSLLLWLVFGVIFFGYVFSVYQKGFKDGDLKAGGILFVFCFFIPYGFYHHFLDKNIDKTKDKLYKIIDMPQFSMNPDVWFKKIINARLFDNNLTSYPSFDHDTALVFENSKVIVWEGKITIGVGRSTRDIFQGLLIEIKSEGHSYNDPVVFVKKGFLNGRKGLKKVELHRPDSYFDVLSNDINTAQNLCLQGITAKLVRLNKQFFKINKMEASFCEDKLYIALYTKKNLFEPIKGRFKDIKQYEKFYDEVAAIEKYCQQFRDL